MANERIDLLIKAGELAKHHAILVAEWDGSLWRAIFEESQAAWQYFGDIFSDLVDRDYIPLKAYYVQCLSRFTGIDLELIDNLTRGR